MIYIIDKYQTLIGAFLGPFLAILSSVILWFLKEAYEKRKFLKNNREEINSIFLMASRDSEESVMDMAHIIPAIRKDIQKIALENNLPFFTPPRLNRVFISEERLTTLKQGLDSVTQQQIDIAISSVKKFNGYLEQFESVPVYTFESNVKLINLFPISKDEALKIYKKNIDEYLAHFEKMLSTHLRTAQRNMLRPIVAQANKEKNKEYNKMKGSEVDEELNTLAAVLLEAVKMDLK